MGTPQCDSLCLGDKFLAIDQLSLFAEPREAFKPIT